MIAKDFDLLAEEGAADYVMKKPRAEVVTAADLLPTVLGKIENHEPPVRWLVDDVPWGRYWLEPSKLLVVGGPTGGAKTALMTDTCFRALERHPDIRVSIANVEDGIDDLLLRGIASRLRLPIDQLRDREGDQLTPGRLALVRQKLESIGPRLQLVRRPFTVERAIAATEDFKADVAIFDYLQDLRLEDRDGDAQDNVRRIMPQLRALADKGVCVVVTAALSREGLKHIRERAGKADYHELDASIFRDASQIEHAMNEGFCLIPNRGSAVVKVSGHDYAPVPIELYHVKTREGQREHVRLVFDGRYQSFELATGDSTRGSVTSPPRSAQSGGFPSRRKPEQAKTQSKGGENEHWLP